MTLQPLQNSSLKRSTFTRRFSLSGTCPQCGEKLVLSDAEIEKSQDQCTSCQSLFAIPQALAAKRRQILDSEIAGAKAKDQQKEASRLAKEQQRRQQEEAEAEHQRQQEEAIRAETQRRMKLEESISKIIVTTGDIRAPYEIIGPVYFSVSNKGLFFNALRDLIQKYKEKLENMRTADMMTGISIDWSFLYGEFSVGHSQFDSAFYVAVEELKRRAAILRGNAIIWMRQDIDMDTTGMQHFYLQMYGTVIRFHEPATVKNDPEPL